MTRIGGYDITQTTHFTSCQLLSLSYTILHFLFPVLQCISCHDYSNLLVEIHYIWALIRLRVGMYQTQVCTTLISRGHFNNYVYQLLYCSVHPQELQLENTVRQIRTFSVCFPYILCTMADSRRDNDIW